MKIEKQIVVPCNLKNICQSRPQHLLKLPSRLKFVHLSQDPEIKLITEEKQDTRTSLGRLSCNRSSQTEILFRQEEKLSP
jgi:hypothetical protein